MRVVARLLAATLTACSATTLEEVLARPRSADKKSSAQRTLMTLDTNHDGVVDPKEVAAFATSQGLNAASVTKEFMDIDTNGDGRLDADEIARALGDNEHKEKKRRKNRKAKMETEETPRKHRRKEREDVEFHEAEEEIHEVKKQHKRKKHSVQEPLDMPKEQTVGDLANNVIEPQAQQSQEISKQAAMARERLAKISAEDATEQESTAQQAEQVVAEEESAEESESAEGSMSNFLAREAAWESEAQLLEQRAQELRLNATLLAKSTARRAAEAGSNAARDKSKLLLRALNKYESGAKKAEVTAAALRAKAEAEVREANDLMDAADAALH